MGIGSGTNGNQTSQNQIVNIAIETGKDVRNIRSVTTSNGGILSYNIVNDNTISVDVSNGGSTQVQTGTSTSYGACASSYNGGNYYSGNNTSICSYYGTCPSSYGGGNYMSGNGSATCVYYGTCPSSYGGVPYTSGNGTTTCNYTTSQTYTSGNAYTTQHSGTQACAVSLNVGGWSGTLSLDHSSYQPPSVNMTTCYYVGTITQTSTLSNPNTINTGNSNTTSVGNSNYTTYPVYTTEWDYNVTVSFWENNARAYHTNRVGRNRRGVLT